MDALDFSLGFTTGMLILTLIFTVVINPIKYNEGYANAVCVGKGMELDWKNTKNDLSKIICVPKGNCEKFDGTNYQICSTNKTQVE